jgi:branched-chain amino acid transport system permease protein
MDILVQQLINALQVGTVYALVALGYTMVYGVLRMINFAHGDVYMLGAYLGYFSAQLFGLSFLPSLIIAMVGAALLGVLIERIAYRPLRRAPRLSVLITAIGVSLFLENGTRAVIGPNFLPFPAMVTKHIYQFGNIFLTNSTLIILGTALILMGLLYYVVNRTIVGKAMQAISYDREAAQLMGIDLNRIVSITFAIGSAAAAAAGVMVGMVWPMIDPYMGLLIGIKAFVAAVMGGIGSIPGAMLGGYLLGAIETGASAVLPSSFRDTIAFALLVVMLLFRPSGILAVGSAEKV